MANLNNYILTFIKISIITTLLFGGLLAQSYATQLVTDSIINMNLEFTDSNQTNNSTQTVSTTVHNKQNSSFTIGNHQLDIKTTFVQTDDIDDEDQQFLAEVKLKKLDESGEIELIGSPTMLILRNKWAEFKLNSEDGHETIEFKIQYQDQHDHSNEHVRLTDPVWLNWADDNITQPEAC